MGRDRSDLRPALVPLHLTVTAAAHDERLAAIFRDEVIGWRKQEMAALLARGIERGEVRPDVPVDLARELAQGTPSTTI